MEKYYDLQLENRTPSSYSAFSLPKEVSAYEMGIGVLGCANTYTKEIKLLNTLSRSEKAKVNEHEQKHLQDPSLPEWSVRDQTGTHLN